MSAPRDRHDAEDWSPRSSDGKYSGSVERGAAILRCFTPDRATRRVADIAHELGMTSNIAYRYTTTLAALGWVERVSSRQYRLSPNVTRLGLSTVCDMGLREHSRRPLSELAHRTSHTSSVVVLDGNETIVVCCVPGARLGRPVAVAVALTEGSRLPAYCTAGGKMLLAAMPMADSEQLLRTTAFRRRTSRTITTLTGLRDALDRIAEDGIAVEDEEFDNRLLAIAAPVWDDSRETVAAVTLTAPSDAITLSTLRDQLAPHLLATASQISAWLGHRRRDEQACVAKGGYAVSESGSRTAGIAPNGDRCSV